MKRIVAALFPLALLMASAAFATTMPTLSLVEKVARADLVVTAKVKREWVENIAPPQRPLRLVTFHEATVEKVHKGDAKIVRVVFGIPGGVLGEIGQKVPGAPTIDDGKRALLFLGPGKGPGGARGLVGLWQGLVALDENDPSATNLEVEKAIAETQKRSPTVKARP
jgi:hypothetical protein